jgi:hypothetical protein
VSYRVIDSTHLAKFLKLIESSSNADHQRSAGSLETVILETVPVAGFLDLISTGAISALNKPDLWAFGARVWDLKVWMMMDN